MARWLRVFAAHAEDQSLVLGTHNRKLTTAYKFNSKSSSIIF